MASCFEPTVNPPNSIATGPRYATSSELALSSRILAAPDDRALGTDDTRGTREVPSRAGESLWPIWARTGGKAVI